jgi:streptogramin lyase
MRRWSLGRLTVCVALCVCVLCGGSASPGDASTPAPGSIEEFPLLLEGWANFAELASGPEGNLWLIENVDHYGRSGWFWRISPTGVVTGEFRIPTEMSGTNPALPRQTFPTDLARGPDGNMWFTDEGVNSEGLNLIGRITPAGAVKEYPIPSSPLPFPEYVGGPLAIAAGAESDTWFTDGREDESGHSFIGRVTPAGGIAEFPLTTGSGADLPMHSAPLDIALGADGNMWFTDQGTNDEGRNLIGRITTAGAVTEFPIPTLDASPRSIALGADGNMWFTEVGVNRLGRITPAGQITEFAIPFEGNLGGLALGADGNIWFTSSYPTPAIGWITPDGGVKELPAALLGSAQPIGIVAGPDGNLWFTDNRLSSGGGFGPYGYIGRLTTPYVPVNVQPPSVSGEAVVGGTLVVALGSWTHDPTAYSYQWQSCDASALNCEDIPDDVEASYVIRSADVGHVLRAVVSAATVAGSASAVSNGLGPISTPPSEPMTQPHPTPPPPVVHPVLGTTITWAFHWSTRYTTVKSLAVNDIPAGGIVDIVCKGGGCPFAHMRIQASKGVRSCHAHRCVAHAIPPGGHLSLAPLFHSRHLLPGTRLTVSVVEGGWIGRSFLFEVRKNRVPNSFAGCLAPGSTSASDAC